MTTTNIRKINMINALVRENVKKMSAYASARSDFKNVNKQMIYVDANESPFETGLNRYPDASQLRLKTLISELKQLSVDRLLLGNGSDEVLDLVFRAFCEPSVDNIITLPPSYGMYDVLANLNAVTIKPVYLDDKFEPKLDEILNAQDAHSKLLFLCVPNNPTGNSFKASTIETLLLEFNGIVVIDEAYIDFSNETSWIRRLDEFPNLIVCQTFSKAYGMAAIRLGMCFASKEIISILNKIKPPYNINQLTQDKAIERLQINQQDNPEIKDIKIERERMIKLLSNVAFIQKVYPSDANFLLVKVDHAEQRYKQLLEAGIVVRNRSNEPLCHNCLRFTIGTQQQNNRIIEVLNDLK